MHDIRPVIPQLFTQPGALLYIGARPDAHSWLVELSQAGHQITVGEIWPENIVGLHEAGYVERGIIKDLIQLDARQVDQTYDYIFWWHGPEHVAEAEVGLALRNLETHCRRLVALACPYGLYPQGAHQGNPYETHRCSLYPEFFEQWGYAVKTDGSPDQAGSEIVAWKEIQSPSVYTEFRKDGWPLCPNCGEDELWCGSVEFQMHHKRPPTIEECISMGLRCYYCQDAFPGEEEMETTKDFKFV